MMSAAAPYFWALSALRWKLHVPRGASMTTPDAACRLLLLLEESLHSKSSSEGGSATVKGATE